jgi:hypothetical protein
MPTSSRRELAECAMAKSSHSTSASYTTQANVERQKDDCIIDAKTQAHAGTQVHDRSYLQDLALLLNLTIDSKLNEENTRMLKASSGGENSPVAAAAR